MEIANPNTLLLSQELEVHCHQKCEPLLLVHCFAIAIAILDVVNYNKSRFFFESKPLKKYEKSSKLLLFFFFEALDDLMILKTNAHPKKKKNDAYKTLEKEISIAYVLDPSNNCFIFSMD